MIVRFGNPSRPTVETHHSMYAKRSFPTVLKDVALFLAAPFIALVYLALFPFFGIGLLLKARKAKRA